MTITRFAPSPTGYLHLGHAYSALFGYHKARRENGQFRLRIEDIDQTRSKPEFETALLEDLQWLGIAWDGEYLRQSNHMKDYAVALTRLTDIGVLYPCFCSRKDIAAAASAPHELETLHYPGTCRHLSKLKADERMAQGAPYALRLDVAKAAALTGPLSFTDRARGKEIVQPTIGGDIVLGRKDAPASYQLCVVIDDARQGVTLVTRGEDLYEATHVQRLIQALLGLPEPDYHHHPLLKNQEGNRLSKRDGASAIRSLREAGHSAMAVRQMVGF